MLSGEIGHWYLICWRKITRTNDKDIRLGEFIKSTHEFR